MRQDYCEECGHLLAKRRELCPFCGWEARRTIRGEWERIGHELLAANPERFSQAAPRYR